MCHTIRRALTPRWPLIPRWQPREHRQLVKSNPSTYGRPASSVYIGKGMSMESSMASTLNWDKDGDVRALLLLGACALEPALGYV